MNEQDNEKKPDSNGRQNAPPLNNARRVDRKKEKEKEQEETEDSKIKWYVTITVALGAVITILLLVLLIQCSSEPSILNPDHPPKETDKNLEPIQGDNGEKLEYEEGGGAVALNLSKEMTVDLSDGTASLEFANPGASSTNMVVWVVVQDTVIAQSGLIPPGYRLATVELTETAKKSLIEGTYDGKFVIHFYDVDSNERALVNSDVPVSIAVSP